MIMILFLSKARYIEFLNMIWNSLSQMRLSATIDLSSAASPI